MNTTGMRRLLGVTFGLALLMMLVGAQLTAARQQDESTQKDKAVTLTGCVQNGSQDGQFVLSATDGKTYQLNSSATPLKDHVGHKVTIKGTMMAAGDAPAPGRPQIEVSSLTMVSQSCT
jgi:D-alanyl-D-alanine carboxypeptidase